MELDITEKNKVFEQWGNNKYHDSSLCEDCTRFYFCRICKNGPNGGGV